MTAVVLPRPTIWTPDYSKVGESLRLPKWARPWERTKEDAAVAAVTLDTTLGTGKTAAGAAVSVVTTAAVATNGMIAFLAAAFQSPGTPTFSMTGTGGLTWATAHNIISGNLKIYIFYAFAPSGLASATTLTATASSGTGDMMATALSLLGVDTVGTVTGQNGGAAATAAWSSGNIAANSGDAMVGGAFEDGNGTDTSTPGGTGVEFADFNDATQTEAMTGVYKLSVAGTDTIAGTWATAASHVAIGASFKAAGGPATPPPHKPMMLRQAVQRAATR